MTTDVAPRGPDPLLDARRRRREHARLGERERLLEVRVGPVGHEGPVLPGLPDRVGGALREALRDLAHDEVPGERGRLGQDRLEDLGLALEGERALPVEDSRVHVREGVHLAAATEEPAVGEPGPEGVLEGRRELLHQLPRLVVLGLAHDPGALDRGEPGEDAVLEVLARVPRGVSLSFEPLVLQDRLRGETEARRLPVEHLEGRGRGAPREVDRVLELRQGTLRLVRRGEDGGRAAPEEDDLVVGREEPEPLLLDRLRRVVVARLGLPRVPLRREDHRERLERVG